MLAAGAEKKAVRHSVPSLRRLCIRSLCRYVDSESRDSATMRYFPANSCLLGIGYVGEVPREVLEPLLDKCNAEQLRHLERENPVCRAWKA